MITQLLDNLDLTICITLYLPKHLIIGKCEHVQVFLDSPDTLNFKTQQHDISYILFTIKPKSFNTNTNTKSIQIYSALFCDIIHHSNFK